MCQWEDALTRDNQLCGGFNRLYVVLFPAVDVVSKQSSMKQKFMCTFRSKRNKVAGQDIKFANNFITGR